MAITYRHSQARTKSNGALVDRRANGGIYGSDVRIQLTTSRTVDVQGIDNHQITDIPIVTAGGVTRTQRREVIIILHQYAYVHGGKTIHSCDQMEMFQNDDNDKSLKVPGRKQCITTLDGYFIRLNI